MNLEEIYKLMDNLLIELCSLRRCSERSLIIAKYYDLKSAIELYYEDEKENTRISKMYKEK